MIDYQLDAQQLCARHNLKFLSCETIDGESETEMHVYVRGISRDQWGEVWCMTYRVENDAWECTLNQRVLRFDLFGDVEIPIALLDDARQLEQYMQKQGREFRKNQVDAHLESD